MTSAPAIAIWMVFSYTYVALMCFLALALDEWLVRRALRPRPVELPKMQVVQVVRR